MGRLGRDPLGARGDPWGGAAGGASRAAWGGASGSLGEEPIGGAWGECQWSLGREPIGGPGESIGETWEP